MAEIIRRFCFNKKQGGVVLVSEVRKQEVFEDVTKVGMGVDELRIRAEEDKIRKGIAFDDIKPEG